MIMKLTQALLILSMSAYSTAQEVSIDSLGDLELSFEKARIAEHYPGQKISVEVSFRKGEALSIVSPGRVQQIRYLVELGRPIEKGAPLAVLRGHEIHHFLYEFETSKKILASAERRYESNKKLYERKAIRESQWMEVTEKYYAAKLEYEHMRHFMDMVISVDEANDEITIAAPEAGIVDYAPGYDGLMAGDSIAVIVPKNIIRLEAALPTKLSTNVSFLKLPHCNLEVTSVGAKVEGFFVTAWTEPLKPECDLLLGQQLLATPFVRDEVYQLARSAVFQWKKSSYILVRSQGQLSALEVELMSSMGSDYLLRSAVNLKGKEILVTSVSAVQGVLLGLGGE